jgi:hypothetical protein
MTLSLLTGRLVVSCRCEKFVELGLMTLTAKQLGIDHGGLLPVSWTPILGVS